MPYYTPPTKSDGDLLTVADWNVFVKGNFDQIASNAGFSVMSFGDGSTHPPNLWTPVPITASSNADYFSAATPTRILVPAAGIYSINGKLLLTINSPLNDDDVMVRISKFTADGLDHYWQTGRFKGSTLSVSIDGDFVIPVAAQFNMKATDYLEFSVLINQASLPYGDFDLPASFQSKTSPSVLNVLSSATIVWLRDGI